MAEGGRAEGGRAEGDWIAGADGCRGGWSVALWRPSDGAWRHRLVTDTEALWSLAEAPLVVAVDMIFGLPARIEPGGRACDRLARKLLGPVRGRSVFSPPARPVLDASGYRDAVEANRRASGGKVGLSQQSFNLLPRVRELDAVARRRGTGPLHEVHPELAFFAMGGERPVLQPKRTSAGLEARLELLGSVGLGGAAAAIEVRERGAMGPDDVVDAFALAWSARRIHDGEARCLPAVPDLDPMGLPMAIRF